MNWLWDTGTRWLHFAEVDLTRYVIFAVGVWLVLWVVLRRPMRGRKIREASPPARQMALEFLFSLRSIALFSTVGFCLFGAEQAGYLTGPALARSWGWPWMIASLLLMIVVHDAYFYWTHRLIHHPRLFRRFHRRHHRSNNPSPFTAYSFDLAEAVVNVAFVPVWMFIVPTDWPVTGLFMLHQIARNTLQHSGYEIMPARRDGRPMFDWLTGVTHHDLHHAEAGWNYGLWFTWWDRIGGTEHPEYHARFAAAVRKPKPARDPQATAAVPATLSVAFAVALLVAPQDAAADTPAMLADDWATPGLGAVVRLHACDAAPAQLCGTLIWVWDSAEVKPGSVGKPMLSKFVFRDGKWRDGTLLNSADGNTYKGEIWLDDDVLRFKGCAGIFCQSQEWRRLNSIPRPEG
jgi:Delta7-sterol 5-desaturase